MTQKLLSPRLIRNFFDRYGAELSQALSKDSGWPLSMCEQSLKRIRNKFTTASLKRLGCRDCVSAVGIVTPGNVPDPLVTDTLVALFQGKSVTIKVSRAYKRFGALFIKRLKRQFPKLASKLDTTFSLKRFAGLANRYDGIKVYGDDETVETMQKRLPGKRISARGHKFAVAIVFKEALESRSLTRTAQAVADDIWFYDQRGCLSPQIVFVESRDPEFISLLRVELDRLEKRHGAVKRNARDRRKRRQILERILATRLHRRKQADEILKSLSGKPCVYPAVSSDWTAGSGYQIVAVKPFKRLVQVSGFMKPYRAWLQAIAYAGKQGRAAQIQEAFAGFDLNYQAPAGKLQNPPLEWNQ